MITTCQFLRIYTEAIENIEDEIIKELQKVDVDFEYTQDEVLESLEEIGNWKISQIVLLLLYVVLLKVWC